MCKKLTSYITQYMQEQTARYAIVLEGDWGSGKTRYCEGTLTDKLYPLGFDVLRVSLFGVTSTEEVYARMAMAMTKLAHDDTDGRARRFLKDLAAMGVQTLLAFGEKQLSDRGITLSVSPQMLTGGLCKNQLIIFDDVERCRADDAFKCGLFGLVNNLIEAQGCKVMFVTNDYGSIPDDIREKVIWKRFRFEPDPETLVRDIILPRVIEADRKFDFDISQQIVLAAKGVSCRNARAMFKSLELLTMAVSCDVLANVRVDSENRACALRDFASYTFLAAMGNAPTGESSEPYAEHINERTKRNAYQQLWVIKAYFDSESKIRDSDVAACLKDYIELVYSGTPETMELKRILGRAASMGALEDSEVEIIASQLSSRITGTVFDLGLLNDAIQLETTLSSWGFEALSDEELLNRAKELVDRDIEDAYRKVHGKYIIWREELQSRYSVLVSLDEYIVEEYEKRKTKALEVTIGSDDPDAGSTLANILEKDLCHGGSLCLDFEPSYIASLFASGNAPSQYAIYDLVAEFKQYVVFHGDLRARAWVEGLRDSLAAIELQSRMGNRRLCWTLDCLGEILG